MLLLFFEGEMKSILRGYQSTLEKVLSGKVLIRNSWETVG